MKILLHICCGPCSVMSVKTLRELGHHVTGYWYNPNIHPYIEYKNRLNALIDYAESIDLDLLINDEYGLKDFVKKAVEDETFRCEGCYRSRLEETAIKAKTDGYDAFSTTLLISPYQLHERLKEIAEEVAKDVGIEFFYTDFRPHFREGQRLAREANLYMQKYCGCIFSEEERYLGKKKKK